MKRRILAVTLFASMLAFSFAGCSNNGSKTSTNDSGNQTNGSKAKTTITVTRWGEIGQNDVEKTIIDKFNKENTDNIEVKYDVVPGDGYGDRLTTSFSSGQGYDIFLSGEGDFFKWVDKGLSAPLDDLIKKDTSYKNTMADSIYKMGLINGSQHYLIKDYNPMVLWYNKSMFDKQGVKYPTDSWTWDDLMAAAKKLTYKADNGKQAYGFNAQSWSYAVYCYLQSLGLDIADKEGKTVDGYLNSDKVATALDKYFGMITGPDKVSPSSSDLDTFGDAGSMMNQGLLAMMISGGWEKDGLKQAGTNYGTALIPGNHTSIICAAGYSIGTRTKNQDAAWKLLKLLTNEDASAMRAKYDAVLPAYDKQLKDLASTMDDRDKALVRTLDYGVQPIGMRSALGNTIDKYFTKAMENIVFKTAPTQNILNDTVKTVKAEAK